MKNNSIQSYKSVKRESETKETIINKSRFIGYAKYTWSQQEALGFIDEVTKKNPEASCICYAYICGMKSEIQKIHDGCEPVGGMPILEILRLNQLTAVCCVVARYFGGTKLGIGGLARAFSSAASEAIKLAEPCVYELSKKAGITYDYQYQGKIGYWLENSEYVAGKFLYGEKITVQISYKKLDEKTFFNEIDNITNGSYNINEKEEFYTFWD